ncbi:unnamed protein product [Mytilus edulis]|uniref:C2H2-type domain-containing protein n=1 Tax=Mytilus edulis TaxID=6550 RepID=A0A8S3QR74_MYTED|nr:unnamed protein product [Mytilus edulis]
MVEDHNIQIEDPTVGNIKISVGTQVENTGKKPGRKKKSETVPAAENETITIQPLSDSDWEEDKDDYYIGSRSRRKIRRPKALKDDYYLPKRKHIDIDKEKKVTHLPKTMKMQPVTDKCEVCSFATGDHNSLRRHSMRHTGQRPYRTVNEQFFLNHIKDHENGLIQEKEHISNTIHDQSTMQIMNENGIQLQDIIEIQQKSAELDQDRTPLNLQMQVQTLESGETQISADDFAKISSYEDLGSSNISSSQLITYALNAIAQNTTSDTECSSIQIINGIQISVTTAPPKDGVTNHSISFHVPVQNHFHSNGSEVVLEQVNQISEIPVQALSFDDVTESVDEEGNNQANEQQVIMTSQGEIVNLVSTATIEDLAQISCIVKDDAEGLRAPTASTCKARSHDNELATFVVGLGDVTIVNVKGENTEEVQDVLQIVVHAFLRLKLANERLNLKPKCVFVHQNVSAPDANENITTEKTYKWHENDEKEEWKYYKDYKESHFKDWDILPSSDVSKYWMWVVCKYQQEFSEM